MVLFLFLNLYNIVNPLDLFENRTGTNDEDIRCFRVKALSWPGAIYHKEEK
jgi:hypothetical protein